MKFNLLQTIAALALAVPLVVLSTPKFAAASDSTHGFANFRGHDGDDHDRDDDNRNYSNNPSYQRGWNDGRADGVNHRNSQYHWRTNNDAARRAYQAGYDSGYRDAFSNRYGRENDRYGRNDSYGRNGGSGQLAGASLAARMGAQDGLNDGHQDRLTGHSFRSTQGDNYKKATRGFAGGSGETAYKQAYREAYVQAYDRGYNQATRAGR